MKSLLTRIRCDSGQAFVLVAVTLTALVGMAALVLDGGSWYQAQRKLQTAADAAALAGAQELPTRQSEAQTVALDFAQRNYSGIPAPTVTFPDAGTIDVAATATAPGVFARIYGSAFDEIDISAHAQARVLAPTKLKDVAPLAVHRDRACVVTDPSCFGQPVTLAFDELDVTKSKFGLLDLDRDGNAGAGEMKDWLENGYTDHLPIGVEYPDASGDKNGIKKELEDAADEERVLLFPVFDSASATGFHVIGWAAFVIDEVVTWNGDDKPGNHVLTGHFVTFIATDLAAGNTLPDPNDDFGVHVITLTK
jgi:Putative Flp pilus-assembly TadE/G-like